MSQKKLEEGVVVPDFYKIALSNSWFPFSKRPYKEIRDGKSGKSGTTTASSDLRCAQLVQGVAVPDSHNQCATSFLELYSYNSAGGRTAKQVQISKSGVTNPAALMASYTYDNEGRVTQQNYPNSVDQNGNVTTTGPQLNYAFDSMGRLNTLLENGWNYVIGSTTYGPANELQAMSGSWGSESRSYNSLYQLTYLSSTGGANTVNMLYNYPSGSNAGKISSQYDYTSGETVTYQYDTLNRLAAATGAGWGQSYAYDGFGNLTDTTTTQGSTPELHVAYDPATNRRSGECADANGNIGSCGLNSPYVYDVDNRIIANGSNGTQTVNYGYAPDNKRVWKLSGGVEEVTFWSVTGQRIGTYNITVATGSKGTTVVTSQTTVEYYFGGKLVKNSTGYVHADRLGSIGKYYPYGQERPSATSAGTEKFATYFRDAETGNDYAVNRYEAPGSGRFMSADPYMASGGTSDPGSWNRYAYTRGDPVNRIDSDGLADFSVTGYCYSCSSPKTYDFFYNAGGERLFHPIAESSGESKGAINGENARAKKFNDQERQRAEDAINNLGDGCKKALGALWNLTDGETSLLAKAASDEFLDGTAPEVSGLGLEQFLPNEPFFGTVGSYLQSHGAFTAQWVFHESRYGPAAPPNPNDPSGGLLYIGNQIILGASVRNDATTLLHEVLHTYSGMGDFLLAGKLGLGPFSSDVAASIAIQDYLAGDCGAKK